MEQVFKTVIWGLGANGKNWIDILGNQNVLAIIDSNKAKLELGSYQEIPIIDLQTYLRDFTDYYIVVTPMKYQEIIEQLK
ncbi:MAG: hypothetical protein RR593_06180, partial [Hungatella sp.]